MMSVSEWLKLEMRIDVAGAAHCNTDRAASSNLAWLLLRRYR